MAALCPGCHELVHILERRGDLDGIDADLSSLADPSRSVKFPELTLDLATKRGLLAIESRLRNQYKRLSGDHQVRTKKTIVRNIISLEKKRESLLETSP